MSLKSWRCPGWFPPISEGSAGFQRAPEVFGCGQSFYCPGTSPSISIWRLLLANSVATEWVKIQDILPIGRSTLGVKHHLEGDEGAANIALKAGELQVPHNSSLQRPVGILK